MTVVVVDPMAAKGQHGVENDDSKGNNFAIETVMIVIMNIINL